jgi:hypothetical protein
MTSQKCPFKAGDTVVYRPTMHGRGWLVHTDLASLVPGDKYKVVRIEKEDYLVVEGFENARAGGVYWTEFAAQ